MRCSERDYGRSRINPQQSNENSLQVIQQWNKWSGQCTEFVEEASNLECPWDGRMIGDAQKFTKSIRFLQG